MKNVFYEELGKKIQQLRKERGFSQRELAQKIGKNSASYITLIEMGKRRISLYSLVNVAKALGVTLNSFLEKDYEAMDANSLLHLGLISDPCLTPQQREMVLEWVEFLRARGGGVNSLNNL